MVVMDELGAMVVYNRLGEPVKVGLLVTQRKTGWLEVDTWIKFARIAEGPLSRRVRGQGKDVGPDRLNDQEVTRLVEKVPDAVSAGDLFAPCATI